MEHKKCVNKALLFVEKWSKMVKISSADGVRGFWLEPSSVLPKGW